MGMLFEIFRCGFFELILNRERCFAGSETGAVGDPKDMSVDGNGRDTERFVEDDIRGLATDPGQRFECITIRWYVAAMLIDEALGGADHILGLGIEEPDRLDVLLERHFAEIKHLLRRGDLFEQ